jgi:hypothetical protein
LADARHYSVAVFFLSSSLNEKQQAGKGEEEDTTLYPGSFLRAPGPLSLSNGDDKLLGYHGTERKRRPWAASARRAVFVIEARCYPGWCYYLHDARVVCVFFLFFEREKRRLCPCDEDSLSSV